MAIQPPDPNQLSPLALFTAVFSFCSFAGLANVLRSGKDLGWRSVISATLNSGLMGLAIAALWYSTCQNNVWFLVGVTILAGLGGTTLLDFVLQLAKKGGLIISVHMNESTQKDKVDERKNP